MTSQQYRDDVVNGVLTLEQLQAKYKQKRDPSKPTIKDEQSLKVLRNKYKKESTVERAPTPEDPNDYFPQVEPAKITPTRRRQVERLSKFILTYGDGQVDFRRVIDPVTDEMELIPQHNIPMHRIIQQINAEYRPETTVNGGDFADFAASSRFDPDSDHYHKTMTPALRWIHDFYAQLVADNPAAHHVEVDSNHAIRPKKKVLRDAPEFYDFYRPGEDYPAWTYYSMANLGKLGIDFISGYGAAEFVYGEEYEAPPIVFKHGNFSSSAPGATVRKEAAENPHVNVVRFHGHNMEMIERTTRDGWQQFYLQLGSSCLNGGPVPGYRSAVDDRNRPVPYHNQGHQNSFAMIEDFQNGYYSISIIDVIDGKAWFRGKEYDGNE